MRHEVRVTREVKQQIQAVSDYISQDSTANARKWRQNIRERIRSLSNMPERHEIAYRADEIGRDIRHTFFGVYRILYTIDGDTIVVVSIRHGARKPLSIEELRRLE